MTEDVAVSRIDPNDGVEPVSPEPGSASKAAPANANRAAAIRREMRALEVPHELRLAVTMNGGVSLAVYIGGVAHELNELTHESGPYADLVNYVGYDTAPVVDVITGTSAGGINATALALAQANSHDPDLSLLKFLWIEHGQIGALLRQPFREGPPSLLKGDEYFYPRILSALQRLTTTYGRSKTDLDLAITTTLLSPVLQKKPDDLGTATVQPQHAGLFEFRGKRPPEPVKGVSLPKREVRDDFSNAQIDQTVSALALAARASAGFPVAFEPTFVPVNHREDLADRPDMGTYADWVGPDGESNREDLSRYAIDGGVLANTPTKPALSGIRRHKANDRLVRRALILVHPHATPAKTVHNRPDMATAPPSLTSTLGGVFRASSSTGSRTYVEEIDSHNDLALRWRDGRHATMSKIPQWSTLQNYLDQAQPSWKLFHTLRTQRGAYVMAHQIRRTTAVPLASIVDQARQVLDEYILAESPELPFLPSVPPAEANLSEGEWHWGLDFAAGATQLASDLLREMLSTPPHEWQQLIPADNERALPKFLKSAKDAWTSAVNAGVILDEIGEEEERAARRRAAKREDQDESRDFDRIRVRLRSNIRLYRLRMGPTLKSAATESEPTPSDGARVDTVMRQMVCEPLCGVLKKLATILPAGTSRGRTGTLLGENPLQGADNAAELMQRLLSVEVLAYLLAEDSSVDSAAPSVPVEFYQLSAQVEQHFASEFSPDDKLAGMSLNRFGAFLKRSWRANDWIWGRLDAIKIIMLILLSPANVRGMSAGGTVKPEEIVDIICAKCFAPACVGSADASTKQSHQPDTARADPAAESSDTHVTKRDEGGPWPSEAAQSDFDRLLEREPKLRSLHAAAILEVCAAIDKKKESDKPLTDLCSLAAYGIQIAVAASEVPWLATTVIYDKEDGAAGARSSALLSRFKDLHKQPQDQNPNEHKQPRDQNSNEQAYAYLQLFVDARIGQESVEDELPGDLAIRTAARAAASSATMITSERSGLGVAKPVTRMIRGAVAIPYWAVTGLAHRGPLARVMAATILAFGTSLVALSLIAPLSAPLNALVPTLGVGSIVTIFVYAALRSRSIVHGAALLGLFIPLVGLAVNRMWGHAENSAPAESAEPKGFHLSIPDGLLAISCVLVLVIGVVLAANINAPVNSPLAQIYFVARRIKPSAVWNVMRKAFSWKNVGLVLGGAVLVAVAVVGVFHLWWEDGPLRHRWTPQHRGPINRLSSEWVASHGTMAWLIEIAVTALPFLLIMAHGWYVGRSKSIGLRPRQMTAAVSSEKGETATKAATNAVTEFTEAAAEGSTEGATGKTDTEATCKTETESKSKSKVAKNLLVDPAGLSVAWSAAYGIMYLVLAIGILYIYGQKPPPAVTAAATAAYVIGVGFSVVAVHVIPLRRERGLVRKLALVLPRNVQKANRATFDKEVIKALKRIGDDSQYLVTVDAGVETLSKHGRRVAQRAIREQDRPSIAAMLTGAYVGEQPSSVRPETTGHVASTLPSAPSGSRS
jgi:patatin-related protein